MQATDTTPRESNGMSATYSPEDNKLRLYSVDRLDKETYTRARALGFIYAPKQQLFVAPMWTPKREDFLLELCGEIGDEDTTLVDRAEQRADRFEDYSSKRADEAESARKHVDRIAERFHMGQPILIGHHSEKSARRDKVRIENGMRRAIKLWDTSAYWTERAAGAISAAKYKELPGVRARRIKSLEAEERKHQKTVKTCAVFLKMWEEQGLTHERALKISNHRDSAPHGLWSELDAGKISAVDAREKATASQSRIIAWAERWLAHIGNRLVYERAMQAEGGGTAADKTAPEVGGACKCWASHRGGWSYIVRVNPVSVTVLDNWGNGGQNFTRTIPFDKLQAVMPAAQVEELRGSRSLAEFDDKTGFLTCAAGSAPESAGPAALAKSTVKPLLNYPGVVCYWTSWGGGQYPEGVEAVHMTKAEYEALPKSSKEIHPAKDSPDAKHNTHRVRTITRNIDGRYTQAPVFLTDSKQHPRPAAATQPPAELPQEPTEEQKAETAAFVPQTDAEAPKAQPEPRTMPPKTDPGAAFAAMKQTLKQGVLVVSAPQLFPTPPALAARMVELAEIKPGHRVLEPSAGTGNILKAIPSHAFKVAVEVNGTLAQSLNWIGAGGDYGLTIFNKDFMETDSLGTFDRVVMNPPFVQAQDIKHIKRALALLKPGGRLVAICADGPRQNEALRPLADSWEILPSGTFDGTGVRSVLLTMTP